MIKLKIYPIGTKVFLVNKKYKDQKLNGGLIIPCKVKTYENKSGKIIPICSEIGASSKIYREDCYYIYDNINDAILSISTTDIEIETTIITVEKKENKLDKKEIYKLAAMKSLIASTRTFDENFISQVENWSEMIANEFIKRKVT